jgi:crotonobetainyl-CoA:carnitine CoA-transferase CaiB-like acyl-CoA transferase
VIQALTGVMSRYCGPANPAVHGIASWIDYFTGCSAASGALIGLLARESGHNEISARTSSCAPPHGCSSRSSPDVPEPTGLDAPGWHALDRLYRTNDGWI